MSNQDISLVLEKREIVGKGLNKLKAEGKVPGVIHRPGKESVSVTGNFAELNKIYQQAGKHAPVAITVGSDKYLTIIKQAEFEPTKHLLRHIVFGTIKQNEKVHTEVPVELVGEAPALKMALLVHQNIEVLEISALPKDLVDSIKVDVSRLAEVGDKINVGDIVAPTGIEIMTDPEHPVVTIDAAHVQSTEPEETAEATAEPIETPES